MDRTYAIIAILTVSAVALVGDYFIKLAGNSSELFIEPKTFALGLTIQIMTTFGWFYSMKHLKLATIGSYYSVSTIVLLTALGYFVFNETLSVVEIAGLLMAISSLVILARFS